MVDEKDSVAVPVKEDPPPKKKETDKMRSDRHVDELFGLFTEHMERINKAHEDYPTPAIKYQDMTLADQERWNQKRVVIDKANRDYHYAIRDAVERHAKEEVV